jgi:hypothetical protein
MDMESALNLFIIKQLTCQHLKFAGGLNKFTVSWVVDLVCKKRSCFGDELSSSEYVEDF